MSAYYNEIDPLAAAWLRELIKAGLIAPGDVDERDIRTVSPGDLRGYRQCHFFAGIGVWSYALRRAGWPDDREAWTGSAPCQPFSVAGRQEGFDDERHLWPAWYDLVRACRPPVIFGEQVASADVLGRAERKARRDPEAAPERAWLDVVLADLERARYAVGAVDLPAAGLGAPHIRQRLWFVAERLADAGCQRVRAPEPGADSRATSKMPGGGEERQRLRVDTGTGSTSSSPGLADAEHDGHDRARGTAAVARRDEPDLGLSLGGRGDAGDPGDLVTALLRVLADPGRDERGSRWPGEADGGPQQPAGRGAPGRGADGVALGDSVRPGLEGRPGQPRHDGPEQPTPERAGDAVGGVDDAERFRRQRRQGAADGRLDDGADARRLEGDDESVGAGKAGTPCGSCADATGGVGDTQRHDMGWDGGGGARAEAPGDCQRKVDGPGGELSGSPSATGDFWSGAVWLPCRDGKWRPVEPGTFPLVVRVDEGATRATLARQLRGLAPGRNRRERRRNARALAARVALDGAGAAQPGALPLADRPAAGVGRCGDPGAPIDARNTAEARQMRLKGYGNAIVAPVAIAFIEAYLEARGEEWSS